jgi:hypothetical protein
MSAIEDQTIAMNSVTDALALTVGDVDDAPGTLVIRVESSNATLTPSDALVIEGSGQHRTLTVTPAANEHGSAMITLIVADPNGAEFRTSFTLTVTPPVTCHELPGDTNDDGIVDLNDLNDVRNHFGELGESLPGDANCDNRIDIEDLNLVRNSFAMAFSEMADEPDFALDPNFIPLTSHLQTPYSAASAQLASDVLFSTFVDCVVPWGKRRNS